MYGWILSTIAFVMAVFAPDTDSNNIIGAVTLVGAAICWNIDAAVKRLREGGGV